MPTKVCSAVFNCIGALGTPSQTGPLARKYLPGFRYSWSLRRLRQKIGSIYCTVIPAAQEQPFTVGLLFITKTVKLTRYALLVFVRSCSSLSNKIISFKKLFHHGQPVGGPSKRKTSGALHRHVPSVPIGRWKSVYAASCPISKYCGRRILHVLYVGQGYRMPPRSRTRYCEISNTDVGPYRRHQWNRHYVRSARAVRTDIFSLS